MIGIHHDIHPMSDTPLQSSLRRAAQALGLDIEIPFVLNLPCGPIEVDALIRGFGSKHGMLVMTDLEALGRLGNIIHNFGYAVHCFPGTARKSVYPESRWAELCRGWGGSGESPDPDWFEG